jgi:hypothetical protein
MTAKTTAKTPRAKPAVKTDPQRLAALAEEVRVFADGRHLDLRHRLETEEGLKIVFGSGTYRATMAGVTATCTEGERMALVNWANAARRAVLRAAGGE